MFGLFGDHRIVFSLLISVSLLVDSCSDAPSDKSESVSQPEPTAKDIVVSELIDPCLCVDAMLMTVTEINVLELESDSVSVDFHNLLEIQNEIEEHCIDSMNFSKISCAECDSFKKLEDAFEFFNRK